MENQEIKKSCSAPSQTALFGILVLTVGVVLLLKNLNIINSETSRIIFSWPMLIIAIGVINLSYKSRIWGVVLIAIGAFFLLTRYLGYPASIGQVFWPTLIIFAGVMLIISASGYWKRYQINKVSASDDVLEDVAVFGGIDKVVHSNSFKGGEVVAVFGGSKINLLNATLAPGNNVLETVTIFGGATLIIPSDWNIKLEVVNILGGFSDKRQITQVDFSKTLIIKGVAIFGGGEIKSY